MASRILIAGIGNIFLGDDGFGPEVLRHVFDRVNGSDGVRATDYVGDSSDRTGFAGLEAVDEVTMLCVPDLMAAYRK